MLLFVRQSTVGEMNPPDLRDTCLNKQNRDLVQVSAEDSVLIEEVLKKLMTTEGIGERKIFFETNGEILQKHKIYGVVMTPYSILYYEGDIK